jgi:hypothetical protein
MSTALIAGIWAAGDGIHGVLTYSAAGTRRSYTRPNPTRPFSLMIRVMSGYGKADALAAGSRSRTVIRRGCPLSAEQPKIFAHVEFFSV